MCVSGLVTVIIPAYNRVDFISETVQSVLYQDYSALELIVIDDGSNDGTYEKLLEYETSGNLILLTHPGRINKGQSASINIGLKRAKGEFIAILDSDDLFAPGKLRKQVDYLKNNPDIGLVYGNGYAIDSKGQKIYTINYDDKIERSDPNSVLLDCYFLLPQNSLVRKRVYDRVGFFDEGFRAAQDHDMLIRIAETTRLAHISEVVFYYRRHSNSISSSGQKTRWKNGFEILRRASRRYPYSKSTIRKRKAVLHFRLGQTYWREDNKLRALPHFVVSGALDPARALSVIVGRERI